MLSATGPGKDQTIRERPHRLILLLCGLFILGCGTASLFLPESEARGLIHRTGYLLAAAGTAEILAGFAHRRLVQIEGRLDVFLGLVSLAAGAALLLVESHTAARFAGFLTLWLLLRGGIDIVAAFLTSSLFAEEGRLIRASVDLVLGLVSYIGLGTTAWWEQIIGWPSTAASITFLFAGISLAVTGMFLIAISRARTSTSEVTEQKVP
jgi:uncharacterized membrane protein HdeD (DUF308 family)